VESRHCGAPPYLFCRSLVRPLHGLFLGPGEGILAGQTSALEVASSQRSKPIHLTVETGHEQPNCDVGAVSASTPRATESLRRIK